ncbi:MAG: hypothetical protein IPK35_07090 [Saprospiraceae bacterium]|nr:hypothetical protein [Saprospiraceae bacterium]
MRQVFFVLSILLISLSMHASQSIKEGSWYNPYLQRNILFHITEMVLGSKEFIRVMGGHGLKDAAKIPLGTDTKIL